MRKAVDRAGLTLDDLDVIELNEAFASQSLAVVRELGLDPAKVTCTVAPSRSGIRSGERRAVCSRLSYTLASARRRTRAASALHRRGMGTAMIVEAG